MSRERKENVKVEGGVESCQQEGGGREVCQLLLKFSPPCMKPPLLNVTQPRPAIPNVLVLITLGSLANICGFSGLRKRTITNLMTVLKAGNLLTLNSPTAPEVSYTTVFSRSGVLKKKLPTVNESRCVSFNLSDMWL